MQRAEWIQIVIGTINVGVLLALLWQFLLMKRQNWINIFSDYTKRYAEIIESFPESINRDTFNLDELKSKQESDDIYQKTMQAMRKYFDLCSQQWFLKKRGWVDKNIWKEWNEGIRGVMSKRAFRDAWKFVGKDTIFYKGFKEYMDSVCEKE